MTRRATLANLDESDQELSRNFPRVVLSFSVSRATVQSNDRLGAAAAVRRTKPRTAR